jgi:hypothetical protein
MMIIGMVTMTEPAISTVVGISMLPASWESPSDTVQPPRFSMRNSSANRNSFQAIMKTNRALAMIAGIASGRLIRRRMPSRLQPSMAAASSRLAGTVSK